MKNLLISIFTFFICISLLSGQDKTPPVKAVATFHCISLYWKPLQGSPDIKCIVEYKPADQKEWKEALPLWYDNESRPGAEIREKEYRGSILNVTPGSKYDVRLTLEKLNISKLVQVSTWDENFKIRKTVYMPEKINHTYFINEGGSKEEGYVLYVPQPGKESVIEINNKDDYGVCIQAPFSILRGATIKGAGIDGVIVKPHISDVVVESCDISGWGRVDSVSPNFEGRLVWGEDNDAGIRVDSGCTRVVVQRNSIHHPRWHTNSWREWNYADILGRFGRTNEEIMDSLKRSSRYGRSGSAYRCHPFGPVAINLPRDSVGGNMVARYNTVYSDDNHFYDDPIGNQGGSANYLGFGPDSDVYGNYISHGRDDMISSEGSGMNIRIWGNYITEFMNPFGLNPIALGPTYIFRNVINQRYIIRDDYGTEFMEENEGQRLVKINNTKSFGGGRIYVFHNTILQPFDKERNMEIGLLLGFTNSKGGNNNVKNVICLNNILHARTPIRLSPELSENDKEVDYNLVSSPLPDEPHYTGVQSHGVVGKPVYNSSDKKLEFFLVETSPGLDKAKIIPTVNDNYKGKGPDIGAFETGSAPLEFGVDAYLKNR